jgi:hypothetical protein
MKNTILAITFTFLSGVYFVSYASGASQEFPVSPPPMTEGMFPCSNCHASLEVNRKKRELKDEHSDIKLHHAETMRWCLDCHDAKNRDEALQRGAHQLHRKLQALWRMSWECLQSLEIGDPWEEDRIFCWPRTEDLFPLCPLPRPPRTKI